MRLGRVAYGLLVAALLAVAGCGDNTSYANEDRAATPITITAAVDADGVRVSPTRFGAGPVTMLIANLTDRTRRVTVESDTLGADSGGVKQQTAPINPQGTAQLQIDLEQGRYLVHAGDTDDATTLRVGGPRPTAQDQLLLP